MNSGHSKRTGRPRKAADQVKVKLVKVRVTHAEREQVKRMAEQRGMTVTDMVRAFLFQEGGNET